MTDLLPSSRNLRLCEWADSAGYQVIRDGSFEHLGLMSSRQTHTLFPCYDAAYIDEMLNNPNLSAVITTPELADQMPSSFALAVAVQPLEAFYTLHCLLAKDSAFIGLDFPTTIGAGCAIHPLASVAATGVVIGCDVIIEAHAIIHPGAVIGDGCVIRSFAIISGQGVEVRSTNDKARNMPHIGRAVLGKNVEIGYYSLIERNVFVGDTEIGDDTVIAAQVIIAHGCRIGRRCHFGSCVVIGGGSVLGDDVHMALGTIVSNVITIGSGARTVIGDTVTRDVPPGMVVVRNALFVAERYKEIMGGQRGRAKPRETK